MRALDARSEMIFVATLAPHSTKLPLSPYNDFYFMEK